MKDFLSQNEITELKREHQAEGKSRFADRIKAILMLNSGVSVRKIAQYLLLDESTIRKYRERYLSDGLDGLCVDWYEGRKSSLSIVELDQLEKELRSKIYPTTTAIISYVENAFGIKYCVSGMTSLLKRLGFSYKKPQSVPGKANAESQSAFLSMLTGLKESKGKNDPLLYMDGTHPQHNSHPDYGWLPRGENTQLRTNTGRKRVTINGALNAETRDIIIQEDQILNADNTIKFFRKVESTYPDAEVIYVILDNAGYYRGKKIREYLQSSKIELLHLPPYAPNLNLIERVWKFFKKKVLANAYYESYLEFRKACLRFFTKRSWRSHKSELETLLVQNFQFIDVRD